MSSTVKIKVGVRNQSDAEWKTADWDFCTKYARGEYFFMADRNHVVPPEYFEDVMAFTSEIDRLRHPSRGVPTPELWAKTQRQESGLATDLKEIFLLLGNAAMNGNDLAKLVQERFAERYSDSNMDSLKRRFRNMASAKGGYILERVDENVYRYNQALIRKEQIPA